MRVFIAMSHWGEEIHGVATSKARAVEILKENCFRGRNPLPRDDTHSCPSGSFCKVKEWTVDERTAE